MQRRPHPVIAAALLSATLLACGGAESTNPSTTSDELRRRIGITIYPTEATSAPGAIGLYKATVTGTWNTGVVWSVKEAGGGAVDATGLYTAPSTPGVYHVVATSAANSAVSATATVTVQSGSSSVAAITIFPTAATSAPNAVGLYKATVTGTSNTGVVWSVKEAGGGSVDATGLYTAPNAPGIYHVVATSAANAAVSATATVTVQSGAAYTLAASATGSGTIKCNSGACASSYPSGTVLTLTATPATGYKFSAWGGDCSGTAACTLTMNANHSVTASFTSTSQSLVTWSTGYWAPDWKAATAINFNAYTHIVHVELWPNADGTLTVLYPGTQAAVLAAAHAAGRKVLVGLGGSMSGGPFNTIAASSTLRSKLIANTVAFMQASYSGQSYDGVDLDFENPDSYGTSITNFGLLVKEFRAGIDQAAAGKLLTMPVGSWFVNWFAPVASYLDQMNVMSYYTVASNLLQYMAPFGAAGIPKSKIGIGFGLDASDVGSDGITGAVPEVDTTTTECTAKMQLVLPNGYGGAMVWAMGKSSACEPVVQPYVP